MRSTVDETAKRVMALSRFMANINGPTLARRRLLVAAIQSVLLYGKEVWVDSLNRKIYEELKSCSSCTGLPSRLSWSMPE